MLCVADKVNATKLAFQQPLPPGREKFFTEDYRDILTDES